MEKTIFPRSNNHSNRTINIIISIILHISILALVCMHRYTKFETKITPEAKVIIANPPKEPEWVTRLAARTDCFTPSSSTNTEDLDLTQTDIPIPEILTTTPKTLSSIEYNTQETAIQEQTPEQTITSLSPTPLSELIKEAPSNIPKISQQLFRQKTAAQQELQAKKMRARKALAQLAQSYSRYSGCDETGDARISIRSNHYGTPSAEQLKKEYCLERYRDKINECLYQSMSIHKHEFPYENQHFSTNPIIEMIIATNGFLQTIKLITSSGNKEIDNYYMLVFKDAGTSFPPVPPYLSKDPLSLNYEVLIEQKTNHTKKFLFVR